MFKYSRPKKKARLSIAPLLDMIFILLIFFVVTTTFSKLPGILINRPDATVTDKLPPNNLLIGITKEGQFYINNRKYNFEQLTETIKLRSRNIANLSVVIVADEDSAIKYAVNVMDICKQAGIDDIAIAEEIEE
jgi:biopolymer transport protein ExbD